MNISQLTVNVIADGVDYDFSTRVVEEDGRGMSPDAVNLAISFLESFYSATDHQHNMPVGDDADAVLVSGVDETMQLPQTHVKS